jgi:hypothetical protein
MRWSLRDSSWSGGAKTYQLLHWPATGLRRYHKPNLFSFISLHVNIFGLQMVLMFVARSYLLRRKRVSGEITDFSMNKDAHEPYLVFFVFTTSFINQWASRIINLTFLPKSVDDESAFRVQKGTPTTELSSLMVRDRSEQFFLWSFVIKNLTVTNKPNFLLNLL